MIKKILTSIILISVITIMVVIIANFNTPNKCIYAESINVSNTNITIFQNECIENEELGIQISPKDYNQTIKYISSNEDCIYFDDENNLHANSICGNVQVSVFVKSAKDETISTTINISIADDDGTLIPDSFLQTEIVEFDRFSCGYNILTLANNPNVSVSSKNNIVNYNYKTGKISLIKDINTFAYDEINICLTYSNRAVQNLTFKVIILDVVSLKPNQFYTINFKNTNPTFCPLQHNCSNSNVISYMPDYDKIYITAKQEGICYYTITGYDYVYKTKIIVTSN